MDVPLLSILPITGKRTRGGMLGPQRDLRYNVGGAINTLTQTGTACALVLLVNVTRPSLCTTRDVSLVPWIRASLQAARDITQM